jgi:hypothetical protein
LPAIKKHADKIDPKKLIGNLQIDVYWLGGLLP